MVISGLVLAIIAALLIGIYVKRKKGHERGPKVDNSSQKQTSGAAEGQPQSLFASGKNSNDYQIPTGDPREGIPPA